MTTATKSAYTHLTLDALGGIDAGRRSGNNRRFACVIHGGDHQLSLSIVDDGDMAGMGTCHSCHVKVIIDDYPGRKHGSYKKPTMEEAAAALFNPKTPRKPQDAAPDCLYLRSLHDRMMARVRDDRPSAYLAGRGLDIALMEDVGYIPAVAMPRGMGKWADRLIFPLWSPAGRGYAGRALWRWVPGMDEYEHKRILDVNADECKAASNRFNPYRRWEKAGTTPIGWYCADGNFSETVIIVEGALDRLALLAVCDPASVIALAGTAIAADSIDWLPRHVSRAVITFDGDEAGRLAASDRAYLLALRGITTAIATPPNDGLGKDASERYRRGGVAALGYIFDAHDSLFASALPSGHHETIITTVTQVEPTALAPIASVEPEQIPAPPDTPVAAAALDPAIMRGLFTYAPWYRDNEDAAILAARWACRDKAPGVLVSDRDVAALLAPLFLAAQPVAIADEGAALPLDLLVVSLRNALASGDSGILFALANPSGGHPSASGVVSVAKQSYGRRVNNLVASGIDFFSASAIVTAENMAELASHQDDYA